MLNRKLATVFIAAAVALVIAPTAGAHKPYREPIDLSESILEDACPFDVQFAPKGSEYFSVFDSGRFTVHSKGSPTLTNLDTGDSKTYRLRYLFQESDGVGQVSGRFLWTILPGDVGPTGEVDPDGGFVHIVGQLRYTGDPDTGAITSFTMRGTLTDVCDELAP